MTEKLKVKKLEIKNIMGAVEINIQPKSELVLIAGANAVGKTSIIKALEIAFRGRKAMAGIKKIVHEGEKEGDILADLGNIIIKRHYTESGKESVKVIGADGVELKRPEEVLSAMYSKLPKPFEFKRLKPKEQKELLINSLNLDIDLPALEKKKQEIYDLRTAKGRDRDNAKAHLEKMEPPKAWEDMPAKEISVGKLVDELNKRKDYNQKTKDTEEQKVFHRDMKANLLKQVENLKKEYERIKVEIKKENQQLDEYEGFLKERASADETSIRAEIDKVESRNIEIRDAAKYREFHKNVAILNGEYSGFTRQIKDIDNTEQESLAKAKMPIPGLEIYDDSLGVNGMPFAQLAESDQTKASIGISMGLNPDPNADMIIGVLFIENGRDLTVENWEIVRQEVKEHGWQLWVQYVDDSGEIGFVIKEGKVAKIGRDL